MKEIIISVLQRLLGFRNYLYRFARYKIRNLKSDGKERDFFAFLHLLPNNGIVLDIGANIGIMTVHLAQHVKQGTVVAFEPMPDNLETLNRIIRHYQLKNVRVESCALGNENGKVQMVMPVEKGARRQGLSHVVHESITERNDGIHFDVPLKKLDSFDFAISDTQAVTGIKMDVENFEQFVLAGAVELLKKHRPVLYIELWDNDNRYRCFDLLRGLGYSIFVNEQDVLKPFDPQKHKQQNFIFRAN